MLRWVVLFPKLPKVTFGGLTLPFSRSRVFAAIGWNEFFLGILQQQQMFHEAKSKAVDLARDTTDQYNERCV